MRTSTECAVLCEENNIVLDYCSLPLNKSLSFEEREEKYIVMDESDMTEAERKSKPMAVAQKWVSQEERQRAYDNRETTDDHGMLIYGIAKDQKGTEYYMVKNSWGEAGTYKGIWYASKAFVRYKTMNIIVHKDAIPAEIRAKLGL